MYKYLFRFLTAVFVFLFFKLTKAASLDEAMDWHSASLIYGAYTVTVVMILWETLARAVSHFHNRSLESKLEKKPSSVFFKTAMVSVPMVIFFSYLFNFHFLHWVPHECCTEVPKFWADAATGYVMGLLIIYFELTRLTTKSSIKDAREKEAIQKELMAAKYEGLKNQVNPHFLFNSFSTLTSLVESQPKVAVEFIDKLSDLYRYVLEHDGNQLVSLNEELDFLSDYVFLLQMRHQNGIKLTNNLNIDASKYAVPALSIQTLVENAVKHNAFSEEEPLEILLNDTDHDSLLVENLRKPKLEIAKSTKIGLKNLSNRVKLTLKRDLYILENETTFKVELPIKLLAS